MTNLLRTFTTRKSLRVARLVPFLIIVGMILAACAGGDEPDTTESEEEASEAEEEAAPADLVVPRVALTSPTQPSYVETIYGPIEYGSEFGLDMTADDFTIFDSHATATQSALAGQADIVGGSFVSHMILREQGEDFKAFCPFVNLDDFVIAGRNGITEVDQLFEADTRVAVDSPGGAAEIILNAMLQAAGTGKTVADIPGTNILESSGLRTSAWAADEVDATVIHLSQYQQSLSEVPDAVIITSLYGDVPVFIKEAYAAPADWLDENLDTAAAFCASVLKAGRELSSDFDLYVSAVNTYVGEPPDEDVLRETFALISEHNFWPVNGDLEPESVTFMAEMAVTAGVLDEVPNPDDVVDHRAIDMALEMLGGAVGAAEAAPVEELPVPRMAFTSPTKPSDVIVEYGPVHYGPEFGVSVSSDDITVFESHATATQTVLAGQADVVVGSFASSLVLNERGQDIKVFCPYVQLDDFVLAGRNGVDSIEQLFEEGTRVAIDSPGGSGDMILNAMLQAGGAQGPVSDLPSPSVIESSGLRTSAWVADEVDATVIHLTQYKQSLSEVPDAVIITSLYENVPIYIKSAFAAPGDWLDANRPTAIALCASVIKASRELSSDFDLYVEAVNEFVPEPPDEDLLRETFDLISEFAFWPLDGGLTPEAVTFMGEIAVNSGVLTEQPDPADVTDYSVVQAALDLLGG